MENKKTKITAYISILLVLLIIFSGILILGNPQIFTNKAAEKPSVSFGYAYNAGQLPGLIGVEKGFFEEQGISLKGRILDGGKEIVEAMLAREIDFGMGSGGNIIPAAAKTDDIVIIAATSWGGGRKRVMVRKDLEISDIAELKGMKIAVKLGGTNYKNLLKLLDSENLLLEDYKVLNMKSTDAIVAMQTGDIDAIFCGEPDCAVIEYNGIGYELTNFDDTETDPNFLIARKDFIEKNPEAAAKFLKGWLKSHEFVSNNRDESDKMLCDKGNINIEIIKISTKYIRFEPYIKDFMIESFKEDSKFLLEQEQIKRLPDFDGLIQQDYLEVIS